MIMKLQLRERYHKVIKFEKGKRDKAVKEIQAHFYEGAVDNPEADQNELIWFDRGCLKGYVEPGCYLVFKDHYECNNYTWEELYREYEV